MILCTKCIITLVVLLIESSAQKQSEKMDKFLQPDDIENWYEFAAPNDTVSCTRECVPGDSPRVCYYRFHVEDYVTLSEACTSCMVSGTSCDDPQCVTADGHERAIITANRRLPGPSIQVCQGDRVVVDVLNKMPGRSTTIHWHGIFQRGTPFNDGVPMITQCPIAENTFYRYDFRANQSGTYFWHSHDGLQKVNGLQGSLIIRQPNDPNEHLYEKDLPAHVIFINDWYHVDSSIHFPGLDKPDPELYATYYLINGRGRYKDPITGKESTTPYTTFRVTPGKSYRFRVVGATCTHCYSRMSIEGHRLTLIATDGNAVKPVEVDYLDIFTGERYDFVVKADQEIKSYWIQVIGLGGPCAITKNYQLAILKYDGSNSKESSTPVSEDNVFNSNGVVLNPANSTCNNGGVCLDQLETIQSLDERILAPKPDVSYTLELGYYYPSVKEEFQSKTFHRYIHPDPDTDNMFFVINNIYNIKPSSPILSQRNDIPSDIYCSNESTSITKCQKDICRCFHLLKVPFNSVVQIVLLDKSDGGGFNHPFHLHGYAFNVMSLGYTKDGILDAPHVEKLMETLNVSKSRAPVLKDTVSIPAGGYTVIRFVADNPGYWLFHCHIVIHHVAGMSLVIQVGDPEDIAPLPKGFPKCGNYVPPETPENTTVSTKVHSIMKWIQENVFSWFW